MSAYWGQASTSEAARPDNHPPIKLGVPESSPAFFLILKSHWGSSHFPVHQINLGFFYLREVAQGFNSVMTCTMPQKLQEKRLCVWGGGEQDTPKQKTPLPHNLKFWQERRSPHIHILINFSQLKCTKAQLNIKEKKAKFYFMDRTLQTKMINLGSPNTRHR